MVSFVFGTDLIAYLKQKQEDTDIVEPIMIETLYLLAVIINFILVFPLNVQTTHQIQQFDLLFFEALRCLPTSLLVN